MDMRDAPNDKGFARLDTLDTSDLAHIIQLGHLFVIFFFLEFLPFHPMVFFYFSLDQFPGFSFAGWERGRW